MANCDQYVIDGGEPRKCARNAVPGDTLCAHHRKTAESTGYAPAKTSPTQRAGADDFDVDAICLFLRSATTYAMAIGDDDVGRSDANNLSGALGLIAALQARIAELEARNAASERDAGRYRWLRENAVEVVIIPPGERFGTCFSPMDDEEKWHVHMDAAIDAHAQGHNQGEPC